MARSRFLDMEGDDMARGAQHTEKVRLRVFAPGARLLTEEEIRALPTDKREAAAAVDTAGVWLEVPCSRDECLSDRRGIAVPVQGVTEKERASLSGKQEKGFWLNLFCPEDSCVLQQSSDVP
jgi:hypothetical protein